MNEINIIDLITKSKEEVIKFGYSKNSINVYAKWFNKIKDYHEENNVNYFSYDLSTQWFKKWNNIEIINVANLNKHKLKQYRAIHILLSVSRNEEIKSQYYYNEEMPLFNDNQKLLDNFITYCNYIGYSRNIIIGLKRISKLFLGYIESLKIDFKDIKFEYIIEHIKSYPNNRKSKNLYLYYLRTFLRYLFDTSLLNEDFSIKIPNLKIVNHDKIPSIWNLSDVKKLLANIDTNDNQGKRDYAIILLAMTTAMRGIDIINLKLQNVNFDKNLIIFVQEKTKTEITLPLLTSTKEALLNYINDARPNTSNYQNIFLTVNSIPKPLRSSSALYSIIKKYCKSLDINLNQKRGIHSFRHTVLNYLFNDEKTSVITITEISGHNNPDSLNSYIKTDLVRLKECNMDLTEMGMFYE